MNYNWLKNNQERAQALDDIISCLNMYRLSLDEIQLLKTTLVYNEEIISAALLLSKIRKVSLIVWKDDLNDKYTYLHILLNFSKMTLHPSFKITKIEDNYLNVEESNNFLFSFISDSKFYKINLKKNLYTDYDFLKPIVDVINNSPYNGHFYLVSNDYLEDGFQFVYLEEDEYKKISEKNIFELYKLSHNLISGLNIWNEK